MSDPATDYAIALRKVTDAEDKVEAIVKRLAGVLETLHKDWRRVIVTNISEPTYPNELTTVRGTPRINAREYPTADQLHQALAGWHAARKAARQAYDAVPADQRAGLPSPP